MPITAAFEIPPALIQLQADFLAAKRWRRDTSTAEPVDEDALRQAYQERLSGPARRFFGGQCPR